MTNTILKYYHGFVRIVNTYIWSDEAVLKRPVYVRYTYAFLLVAITTFLKLSWFSEIGAETPFLLYFGIVVLSAGLGGAGPGIFATMATAVLIRYYFLPPFRSLSLTATQAIQLSCYAAECLVIICLSVLASHASRSVRRSAERFKAMIENSTDAIAVLDRDGKILYASPAAERVTGFTPKELKSSDIKTRLSEEDAAQVKGVYRDILKTENKTKTTLHRFLNKNDEWIWIENTLTNLLHHSSVKGIVSNFRNVTETLFLEKQKDDFIGIATHELKTPVTSIKAYAQILLSRFKKDGNESAATLVEKMDGQLNKLIGLIGDLLDVTRIEGDRLPLNEGLYKFNDLVKETVEELQRTTDSHKIILNIGNNVEVYGDRDRIGQVLNNLITNAIKYSPSSGDIKVSTTADSSIITVCVADKGVGIPAEKQGKVFERFFRVSGPESHTFPGLGLGLYISHEIIKRQGGKIWVESEENKGSTFCFSLPIDYRQRPISINQVENKSIEA